MRVAHMISVRRGQVSVASGCATCRETAITVRRVQRKHHQGALRVATGAVGVRFASPWGPELHREGGRGATGRFSGCARLRGALRVAKRRSRCVGCNASIIGCAGVATGAVGVRFASPWGPELHREGGRGATGLLGERGRERPGHRLGAPASASGWRDSNPRPRRPERRALPSCATPRCPQLGRGHGQKCIRAGWPYWPPVLGTSVSSDASGRQAKRTGAVGLVPSPAQTWSQDASARPSVG